MRRRISLRARITIGSTIVAVLLLAGASAVVYMHLTGIVADKERAILHGITEVYRGAIEEDPGERFPPPGVKQHVAIVAPDGTERMNTFPAGLVDRVSDVIEEGPRLHHVRSGDTTFFVYVDPVETAGGTWYVLATRDTDIAEDVLSDVVRLMVLVLTVGALVFAVGSWFVAGAALRPVEQMRRSAETLVVARRGELLPVGDAHDDLADLARTLNDLLERMRAANERERQMVSDASHELRNPLAVLHAQLGLIDGADATADAAAVHDARTTLARLTRIADSLLRLSRIDAVDDVGSAAVRELVGALTDSVDELRLRSAERMPGRAVDLDFTIDIRDEEMRLRIRADDFTRVVDNLVDNALSASGPRDVRIAVAFEADSEGARLSVTDDAGGFDPEVAAHAFERFVRGRAPAYAGSGLGLAIVAALASKAGGRAVIENRQGVGATVVVTFAVVAD
jgi:signal transduction histidine kinase